MCLVLLSFLGSKHLCLSKLIPAPESTRNRNPGRPGNCNSIVDNLPEVALLIPIVLERGLFLEGLLFEAVSENFGIDWEGVPIDCIWGHFACVLSLNGLFPNFVKLFVLGRIFCVSEVLLFVLLVIARRLSTG